MTEREDDEAGRASDGARPRQGRGRPSRRAQAGAAALCLLLLAAMSGAAEAPLAVGPARPARTRIVEAARSYLGVPYAYGGVTKAGLDCSGLVWRVYHDSFGQAPLAAMPRTARDLFAFAEPLDRARLEPGDLLFFDTTGPLAHVGIYEGEGVFIHAASEGTRTGVIESSVSEKYWASHLAGAGRLIPPAGYLGLYLTASLGPSFGTEPLFRGLDAACMLSYRMGALELGLEARPAWDAGLGVLRLPLVLSLGLDRDLRFFAGPALTLGTPRLVSGGTATGLLPSGGYLACLGADWSALRFRLGGAQAALHLSLEYDRYVTDAAGGNEAAGLGASLKAGAGLSLRWGF